MVLNRKFRVFSEILRFIYSILFSKKCLNPFLRIIKRKWKSHLLRWVDTTFNHSISQAVSVLALWDDPIYTSRSCQQHHYIGTMPFYTKILLKAHFLPSTQIFYEDLRWISSEDFWKKRFYEDFHKKNFFKKSKI